MRKYLRIKWWMGREIIDASLDQQPKDNEITQTEEYWPSLDVTVAYNTISERKINKDGSQQIKIRYLKENNSHLFESKQFDPSDFLWGTSTIFINPSLKSATAEWKGEVANPKYDGKVPCTVLSQSLFEEEVRETVSRLKRKQAEFKVLLLSQYCCCAITGEKTPEVLDAAHVIEAHKGGSTSLNNGILLRSDIHRLYDAGLFKILQDGFIEITGEISQEYRRILDGARVDQKIVSKISEALQHKECGKADSEA